jgi:hypothetical protein
VAHSYWRINVTANQGGTNGTAIDALEFRATVGGADQAFGSGGTPTASTTFSTFVAANAFDNTGGTVWSASSAAVPQWLRYQFPAPVDVLEIAITVNSSGDGQPKNFDVQYSDDGTNWTTEWSEQGVVWTLGETKTFSITELKATKSLMYGLLGGPETLYATKSELYSVLGPPLKVSCTKKVMYVITGPGYPRYKVRLIKSLPIAA